MSTSKSASPESPGDLASRVKAKYGEAASRVMSGAGLPADCCTEAQCCGGAAAPSCDPVTRDLYEAADVRAMPSSAVQASLGCGNPTALAELRPGERVLDLGSGGGLDVLLSARRVSPGGKAYGLDMSDEMLELARRNAAEAGVTNVEFLAGQIEAIPLPDASVDVIISNCVINLSGDKRRVLTEAFRVLAPGGRVAVSDIVVRGLLPNAMRRSMELWVGCIAGALEDKEFEALLLATGFTDVSIEPTRIYDLREAHEMLSSAGLEPDQLARAVDGRLMSAFVRARKPA